MNMFYFHLFTYLFNAKCLEAKKKDRTPLLLWLLLSFVAAVAAALRLLALR